MKAVLFETHGGPDVLEYADFPTPEPGPGQVLVSLKAAALNHLDLFVRAGWPGIKLEYPSYPGSGWRWRGRRHWPGRNAVGCG